MGNPLDITGRCIVCGERCESTGGCDCSAEDYNHVPLKRVWKRTLVDAAELAALHQRAEKAENREQQLRVEIKTLRDEKAALEARVGELEAALRVAMAALDGIESGANSYPPPRAAREALARVAAILEGK